MPVGLDVGEETNLSIELTSLVSALAVAVAVATPAAAADAAHKTCGLHVRASDPASDETVRPFSVEPSTGWGDAQGAACEAAKENANQAICRDLRNRRHELKSILRFGTCACSGPAPTNPMSDAGGKAWKCVTDVSYGVAFVEW